MRYGVALLAVALLATPAAAQIDYRNLDDDRPARVEDAYPVERFAFEFVVGYRLEKRAGGGVRHLFVPELVYGLLPGLEVGAKAPVVVDGGLAGIRVLALYNLTTERPAFPGLGLRLDAGFPVGNEAGAGAALSMEALATRSFGRNRAHAILAVALRQQHEPAGSDAIPRWRAGVAMDHTTLRSSTLWVLDVVAEQGETGASARFTAGLGLRKQVSPTLVLDSGLSYGVARAVPSIAAFTVGLSYSFAVAALMPGGPR
jgi:hypothetical protein